MKRTLTLAWPSRDLHPNARVHWARKAKAAKAARNLAGTVAMFHGWHHQPWPEGRLHVWIDAYPPDKRRRDADGILSALKPSLDGLADMMLVDDRRFVPHPDIRDEVRKGGEIVITVTDESEALALLGARTGA